ncbi:hypothetical protein MsAm2_14110 [Methanolapillus ohkumae]|uniref:Uncharacterized protein n=1 Tax=Methanolapillus ohkumae TaxID=3028298 RepID=A0AA97A6S8_9EURY|nr:hypothetical protein MsAm2_14110 [Methanosarcinaceae archaeon Am2]
MGLIIELIIFAILILFAVTFFGILYIIIKKQQLPV